MIDPEQVRARIAAFAKRPASQAGDGVVLTGLVFESFVLVEMVIELQEEFGVRLLQDDLKDVKTVGDLIRTVVEHGPPPP